jgi:glutamate N-acetyltransferase/amino-acid N-acetyltransferase
MTLTMLSLDNPEGTASWAGMFTKNAFPGSPVVVGRSLLAQSDSRLRGVIINNKISNVFPGGDSSGVDNARQVAEAAQTALEAVKDTTTTTTTTASTTTTTTTGKASFLPSSTGVIGWRIPVDEMVAEMPTLVHQLQSDSALPAAQGIMTTDLYPKVRGVDLPCQNGDTGRLVGIAKGAGMIEPNMATMLVFFVTDIDLSSGDASSRQVLQNALDTAVGQSFNRISVDTDTSTSDTIIILSSNEKKLLEEDGSGAGGGGLGLFQEALSGMCLDLSDDVVRNGEGVSHVMQCTVTNARYHQHCLVCLLLYTLLCFGSPTHVQGLCFFGCLDVLLACTTTIIFLQGRSDGGGGG